VILSIPFSFIGFFDIFSSQVGDYSLKSYINIEEHLCEEN